MSLPPKAVPKPTAAAVSGPGPGPGAGPSPSSQLRAALTSVSLPPGAPGAAQPPSVPPQQYPSQRAPALEERIFPAQPAVAAVYSVPRHTGPPYAAHDLTKGHPNLAGTPPGHASSPGLTQSPYSTGQNAGTAPLVYSPQTQPMNAQAQSRPFATGPRPTHHQFFQQTQMQTARPALPGNNPSLRPGSQAPAPAAVYQSNQAIMMTMAPMPFPSPQAAQYYIPQYRHSTPYVGPPQQYSVQPPGPGTFYPSPGPGEFPTPYAGPPYYTGQTVYPPSPPIIVPTPQQPLPTKREKKTIRIRDPNQGGKDITEEIMSGGSGSRNPTPPAVRPSSTPTPPQVFPVVSNCYDTLLHSVLTHLLTSSLHEDDKPKPESPLLKCASPGLRQLDSPVEKRDTSGSVLTHTPYVKAELPLTMAAGELPETIPSKVDKAKLATPPPSRPESTGPEVPPISQTPPPKAVNGLSDREVTVSTPGRDLSSLFDGASQQPSSPQATAPPSAPVQMPCTNTNTQEPSSRETVDKSPLLSPSDVVQLHYVYVYVHAHHLLIPPVYCIHLTVPSPPTEPTELGGKRQYDRDFLLSFQFMPACMQKPEGLPPISDVVLDKINQNKLPMRTMDSRVISRGPDFTPAFADFGRQLSGGRGAPVSALQPRKIIMNVSVNDDVQLKKAENAWKPGMKREGIADDPDAQKTKELFRKVRSILNKLTPQMFNQLMKQVTDLTIDTEERLKGVIDLVFEKAIDEPSFSVAYSHMCRCLATLKVPMADKPSTTVNFRKLLLNRCQKEFERDKVDDVVFEKKQKELEAATSASERERLQEELEEAKDKARRRSIGNIKFIGELFKLKMLTEAIMHDCVVKLLKNHDEESLECLCRLLTTIGKDLDFEKAKPRMDQYFNQMEKIVKERKTSSRIRFMLQDVIDLRLHNWVSRRVDQGPKTIEQIHKEARIEEQEEQRKVHQQLLSKENKRRPEQREQRALRDETWSTVPMTKNSRTIDPNKIPKISKPTIDDKIQLGPRAQVNWMKGSSGGAKTSDSGNEHRRKCRTTKLWYIIPVDSVLLSLSRYGLRSHGSPVSRSASRSSTSRERNDKPLSPAPTRPTPFSRSSTVKDLPESPGPEDARREVSEAPCQPTTPTAEDKAEPERSRGKESVKPDAPVAPPSEKPLLSEEEMERKCKSIIDEFLHITDYKEAVQCVEDLDQEAQLHVFVRMGVESTLERSQITRDHMGLLLFQLVQTGTLPKAQFFKGFVDMLELADDMAIDIPHIWLYLAELLSPMLRDGGISMRELFSELSKPLLPVGRAGILFSEILHLSFHCISGLLPRSHRKVGALWKESGFSWRDFLPEGEDVHTFISDQKLEFTMSDCLSPSTQLSGRALSPQELNTQLEKLLMEDAASDEQIFDWVEAHLDECEMSSPPFLRALMTAVCKAAVKGEGTSCRVDTAIIQRRLPVLLKYLNSDTERQLQALYALQALIVTLDQPPNLLRMFFDCLYDEDVISEDAFYKWEASKDPAEQLGKGVALKSVTAFFTWLREAEEESEDN
uniref:Eukaryotic translation initiation factor 4 gamma 3 n=1 Tax=Scleropages formosus TaxID=113540 RepID=A0A8C9TZ83_SCLFO